MLSVHYVKVLCTLNSQDRGFILFLELYEHLLWESVVEIYKIRVTRY